MSPVRPPVLLVVAPLLLGACTFGLGGPDIEALEQAIAETGDEQRPDLAPWSAACPDAPSSLSQGDTFTCTATAADGTAYVVDVMATDDEGNVNFTF